MRLSTIYSCVAASLLLGFSTTALSSGGDDFTANRFASEYDMDSKQISIFAAGNVGVVAPTYWRIYHYLAFQAAKGKPLTQAQLATLEINGWHIGNGMDWDYSYDPAKNGSGDWIKERAVFAKQWGLPQDIKFDIMAEKVSGESYLNCHEDAFRQATVTLKAHASLGPGGKPDAWHKAWLQGQDAVFANCEEPPHQYGQPVPKRVVQLPPALPANAPEWIKYDRAYQTAAANFYARNFDAARAQFQAIAKDDKSPWQKLGAYLAARCLIRKGVLEYPLVNDQPSAERTAILSQAKKELDAIASAYAPAKQLTSLVDARINPTERIAALARTLEKNAFSADTRRLLSDYLVLMDRQTPAQMITAAEPMTAWIGSMQAAPADPWTGQLSKEREQDRQLALKTVRQRWAPQGDPLWMAPLLALVRPTELSDAERKAAAGVPASHPLYQTVQYNLIRLAIAENQAAQADKDIDRLLAAQGKSMSVATSNRFKALKMLTAGSQNEFLKAALRKAEASAPGTPIDGKPADPAIEVDGDYDRTIYRFMPMAELKTLLKNPQLPAALKPNLQETILARALIFNDEQTALELLDTVAQGRNTTKHLYTRYRDAKSSQDRKIAGTLILINTPELAPAVFDKQGRQQFWGCKSGYGPAPTEANPMMAAPPRYLSQQQLDAAAKEQQILLKLPLRTEFIAPTLLDWAKQKPNDEEAPKALHFLIASTRMECPYGTTKPEKEQARASYSREAFNLQHKLYPNSSWTKQTKYYF
ncbi:hypothetical protein [Undibacterium terreum]|nr:hypothetical protein [Undibacterium terreum]